MRNRASVQLQGADTYKMELCGVRILLLHDILYASEV